MQCSPPYVQPRVEAINDKIYLTTTWGWPKYQHFSSLTVCCFFFFFTSTLLLTHSIPYKSDTHDFSFYFCGLFLWYTRYYWVKYVFFKDSLTIFCFHAATHHFFPSVAFFERLFFQHGISEIQPTEQHPPALVQGRKASCHRKHFREFITLQDCNVL